MRKLSCSLLNQTLLNMAGCFSIQKIHQRRKAAFVYTSTALQGGKKKTTYPIEMLKLDLKCH